MFAILSIAVYRSGRSWIYWTRRSFITDRYSETIVPSSSCDRIVSKTCNGRNLMLTIANRMKSKEGGSGGEGEIAYRSRRRRWSWRVGKRPLPVTWQHWTSQPATLHSSYFRLVGPTSSLLATQLSLPWPLNGVVIIIIIIIIIIIFFFFFFLINSNCHESVRKQAKQMAASVSLFLFSLSSVKFLPCNHSFSIRGDLEEFNYKLKARGDSTIHVLQVRDTI